jgi:hypothetical protein
MNDAVRDNVCVLRQAFAYTIKPDGMDPQTLRCCDFPLKVVAYHPGLSRVNTEHAQSMQIGTLIGFAESMLAFYLNVIEAPRQIKAHNLGSLGLSRSVCHQTKKCAARP